MIVVPDIAAIDRTWSHDDLHNHQVLTWKCRYPGHGSNALASIRTMPSHKASDGRACSWT